MFLLLKTPQSTLIIRITLTLAILTRTTKKLTPFRAALKTANKVSIFLKLYTMATNILSIIGFEIYFEYYNLDPTGEGLLYAKFKKLMLCINAFTYLVNWFKTDRISEYNRKKVSKKYVAIREYLNVLQNIPL